MYRTPSARRKQRQTSGLNLIPILDSVFILVFFLLASAQFVNIKEIASDIPILSSKSPPPKKKKELALTLEIYKNRIDVNVGIPSRRVQRFAGEEGQKYELNELHDYLVELKKRNLDEETVVLEPKFPIKYEHLVEIMDAIRLMQQTDESLFKPDENGIEVKVQTLFSNIIFGNIMS